MSYPPWYGLPSADAVHMAAGLPDCLAQLLDVCGPESVDEADAAGWTALHRSAAEGDAQRVQRLLAHGADVAAPTSSGEVPLTLARLGGHTACIAEMARAGAANCLSRGGLNALHVAIRSGDAAGVQALLDAAVDQGEAAVASLACRPTAVPTARSWEIVRTPPACLALDGGHTGILRMLLEAAPCAAECSSQYGNYPLHCAVMQQQADAVGLLLQAAPAVAYQHGVCMVSPSWRYTAPPIHMAAHTGDITSIAALLEVAPDTATEGSFIKGLRPLHLAAKFGHDQAVARLLQAAPGMAGVFQPYSPLYAAAQGGHAQVVRRLLQAAPQAVLQPTPQPAIYQAEAAPRQLPLHAAVAGGHPDVVRLLVAAEPAAVRVPDGSGRTPVSLALLSDLPSATREALLHSLLAVYGDAEGAQQQLEEEMGRCLAAGNLGAARALLACMTCTLPLLELLSDYNVGGTGLERSLYAELIERQPLSAEQWDAVPYSLPGLAGALPAVLARSEAEAGQLVAHLSKGEQQRLRAAALCLHRASQGQLPVDLSSRILVEVVAGPHSGALLAERRQQAQQLADRVRAKHTSYYQPRTIDWDSDGLQDDYGFSDEEEEEYEEQLGTEEESDEESDEETDAAG